MIDNSLRVPTIVLAVLMLLVAALACNPSQTSPPGAPPDTVTPYRPGGEATQPSTAGSTVAPTVPAADTPSGGGGSGSNLVITSVTLSNSTPALEEWVTVAITVQNQGGADAVSYELVLIPHYGWGPPNPAGFEELPTLAPGATHSHSFTPGALYPDAGTFTLRVLVTDDWYALGNPDSTGTAGDYWDETITVGGG